MFVLQYGFVNLHNQGNHNDSTVYIVEEQCF
jgi:hypothetical protein